MPTPPLSPPLNAPPEPTGADPMDAPPDPTQDQAVQLSPDQLNAAGMAGATVGQSWTLTGTIATMNDSGATLTVDHAEQEGADEPGGSEPTPDKTMPKIRSSMKPSGPGDYGMA